MSSDQEKRTPVKRSCNTCRQQKVKCDVVQSPFKACSRCRRVGRECKVEMGFKPDLTPKRSKVQREIEELRRQLAAATQGDPADPIAYPSLNHQSIDVSLDSGTNTGGHKLGEYYVSENVLGELYRGFFTFYHPFLPFLTPEEPPNHYFQLSPLLGWSIVMVAARRYEDSHLLKSLEPDFLKLLWSTIQEMPQSYQICKALCLLCFWPIPETQNFKGPTYQLSGVMMQIAAQNMLHVPIQTQLLPLKNISESEQRDRVMTWVACNIVAQSVSNVYGFLPQANFRFILGSNQQAYLSPYNLPEPLLKQLRVARYCNMLTDMLYCSDFDSSGLPASHKRTMLMDQLSDSFERLQIDLNLKSSSISLSTIDSVIPKLHLLAANVQLRAFAFLIPQTSPNKELGLFAFYDAVCTFLQSVTDFETSFGYLLEYCSMLIFRTILSCIMALLKLLNSPLSIRMNFEHGKALFSAAVLSARRASIHKDDFEYRMSTTIPEMWRELGAGAPWDGSRVNPLILKVQTRMSFSHGYDCLYHHLQNLKAQKVQDENQDMPRSTQQSVPFASGPEVADQLSSTFLASMDEAEFMDWMLGDINFEYTNFEDSI